MRAMTSTAVSVLQRLQSRAAQADTLIAQLKEQIKSLHSSAAARACLAEEEKLTKENSVLRGEVESLKARIVCLEKQHGVKQVSLPGQTVTASQPAPPVQTNKVAGSQPDAPSQTNKSTEKQAKKAKKQAVNSKAKDGGKAPEPETVDVSRLDMRVGFISSARLHPDADTLYVEEVDLAEERGPRTIVSGLVRHVPLDQMQQRLAIFLVNLKPAKMRGILSEGMIMCGSTPDKVEIIDPPPGSVRGDRVIVDNFPGTPDSLLNPKKKIWEQIQPELRVNSEGLATYRGEPWRVEGRGTCEVPSLRDVIIK